MKGKLGLPLIAGSLLLGAACGGISFQRPVSDDEHIIQQEIHDYYSAIEEAFATANPGGLTALFDPSITHPMTHQEIEDWANNFFKQNKNGHFKIEKLDIESYSYIKSSVVLTYKVETPEHKGDFGGTERDNLIKNHGHWYIAGWDKVDPSEKSNKIDTIFHAH